MIISRKLASKTHIFIAVYQFVYIYTPMHDWRYGLASVQWLTFPLLLATGSWLVLGRRLYGPKRERGARRSEAPGHRQKPSHLSRSLAFSREETSP
ncbi:hypothetical protein [Methylocella sp.]|uniref:hypothetical protein n=1 Tax=Methylocella sp. TaxID=1978226 RepID=UPI003C25E65E